MAYKKSENDGAFFNPGGPAWNISKMKKVMAKEFDPQFPLVGRVGKIKAVVIVTEIGSTIMCFCGRISRIGKAKTFKCSNPRCSGRAICSRDSLTFRLPRDVKSGLFIENLTWAIALMRVHHHIRGGGTGGAESNPGNGDPGGGGPGGGAGGGSGEGIGGSGNSKPPPAKKQRIVKGRLEYVAVEENQSIISAKGSLFFDELGRSRIFRGTNVVYKAFPYVPQTSQDSDPLYSFNQKDISLLASNGVTAVRLGVLWAGVEPTKGNYNQTYLTELTKIVQMCSDVGIYVLLDFHQDIMSERFCGQGVPSYIVDTNPSANSGWTGFPVPLRFLVYKTGNGGIPSAADCQSKTWTFYQTADSVVFLYQQLYENKDGVRDAFIAFWTVVAKTFLPFKNILGYDLINEPFMGNIYTNPLLLDPLYANRVNLQPFYDVVSTAIRTVDPNAIIHFEPATLIQKSAGFTNTPGGKDFSNKSVFNFHYYADAQRENGLNDTLGYRIDSAISLNCGAFLGEFEMGYNSGKNLDSIRQTFQAADLHLISATGWEYKEYIPKGVMVMTGTNNGLVDSTGSVREDFAKVFSRPYAHAIAGIPTGMAFDDGSKIFTLNFTFNGQVGVSGTTEIRGNFGLFHKPYGSEVKVVSTSGVFSMLPGNGVSGSSVFVAPDSANLAKIGTNVTITVLARTSPPPAPAVTTTTTVTASAIAVATKSGIIPLKPLLVLVISFFFFL
ncbi:hypothetical protein HDU99_007296 [Rhizoclosmatium hyalinum]|nr:hypothetical protein HDU99_007296 [Rhizoclosmatium hyalinum]